MTTSADSDPPSGARNGGDTVVRRLRDLARNYPDEKIPLGRALEHLGDRAFGLLMLTLALPMATPLSAIPGVSTVIGAPLLVICCQLALGFKGPRLPKALSDRAIDRAALVRTLERTGPWLDRIERVVRPRWPALTGPMAERLIGVVAALMTGILALPIPGGNQPPALAVALFAVAISERDGLFVVLGLLVSVGARLILAVIYGLLAAAGIFIFRHATG